MPKIELFKNNTNLALAPASSFTRMVPRYKITHAIQILNIYLKKKLSTFAAWLYIKHPIFLIYNIYSLTLASIPVILQPPSLPSSP